jgi:asparagine synthase (glutamine-hydrolysing)
MCGIAGFTGPGPGAERIVADMNRALDHRGPDGSGCFVDAGIALGHTRLAIVDLAGGAQPRVDAASGDALTFNGEIYGYRALAEELRKSGVRLRDRSDTEVLFQLIRRDGLRRAVERVDGMFAFAFRDGATGTLYLVRDRFGQKPLYYGFAGDELVFASEAGALFRHPALRDAAPDRLAAWRLLLFEYLPRTGSGWVGIERLEPATILTFRDGRIGRERYWRPPLAPRAVEPAAAVDRLGSLLRQSVRRAVVADVPVGVFLSGGLDSSLVAALAAEAAPDLTALTVRIEGGGFDETRYAATVARRLGLRHEIVELGQVELGDALDAVTARLSEPLADSSLLPSWLVCRAARRRMTVALGGDGADELFAGYPNFLLQRLTPAMARLPRTLGRIVAAAAAALPRGERYMGWPFLAAQLAQGFGTPPNHQSYLWMAPFEPGRLAALWRPAAMPENAAEAAFAPIDRCFREIASLPPLGRLLHLFLVTYLPDDILTKTDRASMFNGLEVRAPFLDRDFAEYACALPARLKLRGLTRKFVLKELARRRLPATIVDRKKHGFAVPIGGLMRTHFRERCRDTLLSRANPVADWFERSAVEALLAEHLAGRRDHGKKLWALYMLFAVAQRRAAANSAAGDGRSAAA